jgi:hypothetical protein
MSLCSYVLVFKKIEGSLPNNLILADCDRGYVALSVTWCPDFVIRLLL